MKTPVHLRNIKADVLADRRQTQERHWPAEVADVHVAKQETQIREIHEGERILAAVRAWNAAERTRLAVLPVVVAFLLGMAAQAFGESLKGRVDDLESQQSRERLDRQQEQLQDSSTQQMKSARAAQCMQDATKVMQASFEKLKVEFQAELAIVEAIFTTKGAKETDRAAYEVEDRAVRRHYKVRGLLEDAAFQTALIKCRL